jgi:hypothetical protein
MVVTKALGVRSFVIGSALAWGLIASACSSGSKSNAGGTGGGGDSGSGASSSGGSSKGGSSNGGTSNGGSSGSTNGGTSGTAGSTAGTSGADWCGDGGCICSNGEDDDGDGFIDGFDPECTGPLDNDEGSFSTGIPGDNRDPKWQDCFYDGNSGAGDDGCRYSTDCLYGTLEQDDPDCVQSQECIDFCRRLVPNGCDCFGCCTVRDTNGDELDISIGASCSLDNLDDEDACPRCEKATDCNNDCGECELCLGKTLEDLPPSCNMVPDGGTYDGGTYDGGTGNTCDNGEIVCSTDMPCPGELYCSFGCCIEVVH